MQERPITLQELRNVVRSRRVVAISALNALAVLLLACGGAFIMSLSLRKAAHADRIQMERRQGGRARHLSSREPLKPKVMRFTSRAPPARGDAARNRPGARRAVPPVQAPPREYPVEIRSRRLPAPAPEAPEAGGWPDSEVVDPLAGDEWE